MLTARRKRARWAAIKPKWMEITITHAKPWMIARSTGEKFTIVRAIRSIRPRAKKRLARSSAVSGYIYLNGNTRDVETMECDARPILARGHALFIEILGAMPPRREPTNSRQTPFNRVAYASPRRNYSVALASFFWLGLRLLIATGGIQLGLKSH